MAQKGKVYTGARALFSIKGNVVGYAKSVSLGEGITFHPLKVLGNIEVEEHVPVSYEVTFSASMFRMVGSSLKSLGLFPSVGGNVGEHLENILNSGEMVATLEDKKTRTLIAVVEQVKIASHNYTVEAETVVGTDVEFVAVRTRDESELA